MERFHIPVPPHGSSGGGTQILLRDPHSCCHTPLPSSVTDVDPLLTKEVPGVWRKPLLDNRCLVLDICFKKSVSESVWLVYF